MRRRLRLFPLNTVLFPGAALNLHVFEPRYRQMIEECVRTNEDFGVVLIAQGAEAGDPNVRPHDAGTVAEIVQITILPFERYYLETVGRTRFRIVQILDREPYLLAEVETFEDASPGDGDALVPTVSAVRDLFGEYQTLLAEFSGEEALPEIPDGACAISYAVAEGLQVSAAVKQHLLEIDDVARRLDAERSLLERVLPQLRGLLERRRKRLLTGRPIDRAERGKQERFFGKFFSTN